MGVPRRSIAPDFPDIYTVFSIGITIKLYELTASFGADYCNMGFELGDKLIKFSWSHVNSHEEEDFVHWIKIPAYAITGRWLEEYDLWDESRAKALLEIFGIRELAGRIYGTLSEGERKRAQIARSLMADPEILLLDEPAAGLDLGGREDILSRISKYLNEPDSPASVIVTHHIEEIPAGTTHVLILKEAKIFAAGPINETLTEPNIKSVFGVDVRLSFDGIRYFAASTIQ